MRPLNFAVIGINHDHVNGQIGALRRAGATCAGFYAAEDDLAAAFAAKYPEIPRAADVARLYEDPSIQLIVSAAIPADRAAIAIAAMRHGKDVMLDKPGVTSLAQLAEVRAVQAETRRIVSIMYSEHFEVAATVKAGELVAAGAIGEVVNLIGMGPHRLRKPERPSWFFERERYGGVLTDIASHQCEQFLFFAGADDAEILSASVGNRANPDKPGLQDVGDMHLRTAGGVTGYIRVDWFTPDGLPTWGDGRLTIIGTHGTIELRKYLDVAGRPGKDHLFLVDRKGMQHIDCSSVELPYGRQLIADVLDRTETAMPQARCFKAMEIALNAQHLAETGRLPAKDPRETV
ncbi:gfo/Idh/MocA family oxidoreductase [Bosea caraganae]|uniref:Gfo/Idh/MocA family oxidoreductase n=1 Tax=Bosea caraganae TaxID=2763117 RepID=A0A370KXM8_9HYPH|nr:Gfo/Idh/MocA family oxidoreductase [Bosea caraganae]RDJ19755.1 gfo/Idh/MocA family oxidoreductase [Bosea caraganae]RDJ21404.1 gfo/Idh/MocA family oxidoreductase [Bosea caraganae]